MTTGSSIVVHAMVMNFSYLFRNILIRGVSTQHGYERFAMQIFVPESECPDANREGIVPMEKVPKDFIGPGYANEFKLIINN